MSDVIKIVVERNQVSGVRIIDGLHVMHTQQEINRTTDSVRATEIVSERLASNNFSWGTELDAQRLRADTAEAEALQFRESSAQIATDLIAAEQRIAGMLQICRDVQDDPRLWLMVSAELSGRISAALNPNPEAESHACKSCFGSGHAHSDGMPISGTCDYCKGTGHDQ